MIAKVMEIYLIPHAFFDTNTKQYQNMVRSHSILLNFLRALTNEMHPLNQILTELYI